MTSEDYDLELLNKTHDRTAFRCGESALDRYLKEQANQDMKRYCATVVVAVKPGQKEVLGYYCVSAYSVRADGLPEAARRQLPLYEHLPAVLLGRLAVSEREKGQGLGFLLLANAVSRACQSDIAWAFLVVKAKHEQAAAFYRHYGFLPFEEEPLMLWNTHKNMAALR